MAAVPPGADAPRRWLRKHLRITGDFQGESFFVHRCGILWATPIFLVLVLIEASDVVFAVDSIPAIFADMADRFHLLKYGLAIVLLFIGGKMPAAPWFQLPIHWSLAIVAGIILTAVVSSLALSRHKGS